MISAFQFLDPTQATSFANEENGSLQQPGVSPLGVSNVPGATGFLVHTSVSGIPVTEYLVAFIKGSTDITVDVVTESGDLTAADATSLASQQWANVPTPTDWTPLIRSATVIGVVLLSLIIVLVARRRRYPAVFTARPPERAAGPWNPPSLSPQGHHL